MNERFAVVEIATGTVLNVIMLVPGAGDVPQPGTQFIQSDIAGPDWHWDGAVFTPPPPTP